MCSAIEGMDVGTNLEADTKNYRGSFSVNLSNCCDWAKLADRVGILEV